MIGPQGVIGVTTKTKANLNHRITDVHIYNAHYDIAKRERELIMRRWKEIPVNQMAIMTPTEACEYLGGVSRSTLKRWHERGVLVAMVNPSNNFKSYLLGHLWVFKMLFLENENGD